MKKSTKFISLLLAVLMTVSCFTAFAVISSSAADGEGQKVYFQYPKSPKWGDPNGVKVNKKSGLANVYCYCYSIYGNTTPYKAASWQARSTQCKYEGEVDGYKIFSFDVSVYGHIDDNADYGIIFSTQNGTGYQTTDITMSSECIGDTIVVIEGSRQNASDSKKMDDYAKWQNKDETEYGVKANISSLGELMPGVWPKYQPRAQQLSNALKTYLFNPINVPYFDYSHNMKLCQGLEVTPLEVYNQYMNDNADFLARGTAKINEVASGKEVYQFKAVEAQKKDADGNLEFENGEPAMTMIPAPEYVMEVLGLTEADINPTTAPEPTTVAPTTVAPTTVAPTTVAPTTVAPTTVAPTTVAPTTVPVTTVPETTDPVVADDVYSLAGSPASVFGGAEWKADNEATDMTKGEDGKYSIVLEAVPELKNIQFKVITNHDWANPSYGDGEGNFVFNTNGVGDVTVTFDPETKEITATGDTVYFETELVVDKMYAVGNGEGTWLNGLAWGDAFESEDNVMTEVIDKVYEITFTDIPAFDNWQIKFAANGNWTSNWGNAKPTTDPETGEEIPAPSPMNETVDAVYDGGNIVVNVEEDGSTVKAQLDLREFDFATKKGAKYTITVTAPEKEKFIYGDVNGDKKINIDDATLIQKAGVDLIALEGAYLQAADVNGDGRISILDATAVQKYVAKYTDGYFKAGEEFEYEPAPV